MTADVDVEALPRAAADGESVFRENLRKTATQWQERLGYGASQPEEVAAIAREARELARVADARTWRAVGDRLRALERLLTDGSPTGAARAIEILVGALSPTAASGESRTPAGENIASRSPTPPARFDGASASSECASVAPPPWFDSSLRRPPPQPARVSDADGNRPAVRSSDSDSAPASPPRLLRSLLGLRAVGQAVRAPRSRLEAPPSLLGLTAIARSSATPGRRSGPDLPAPSAPRSARSPAVERARELEVAPVPSPSARAVPRWIYGAAAGMGALGLLVPVAVIGTCDSSGERAASPAEASPSSAGALPSPADAAVAPTALPALSSPELRALIEAQIRLESSCRTDPARCAGWTPYSIAALTPVEPGLSLGSSHAAVAGPLPAWLQRLKAPGELPMRDEPAVKAVFDYCTRNIAGRAQFQQKHFACSAYDDVFDGALAKYGAPGWLKAVVYQESGCDPVATSSAGARGLWQFMPESARAYGLRVLEDEVDERLDPFKSTDAAIHFLTDLRRDLGSWELALAAYNMGPLAVTARVVQIGQEVTFWDLARAGLLPEETTGYVPAIEAYALVLENLRPLNLGGGGKHLQGTTDIVVKPGVRLSFVARAAHTSAVHIRELNRAYLRDAVPREETTVWVPDAEAHRAEVFLQTASPDDTADACVPEDFDWGTSILETSRYAKKCAPSGPKP